MDKPSNETPFSKVSPQAYYPDYTLIVVHVLVYAPPRLEPGTRKKKGRGGPGQNFANHKHMGVRKKKPPDKGEARPVNTMVRKCTPLFNLIFVAD